MAMFQTCSTKDEIEMSIGTFQRVRDEIENTFSKIEWRDDENGRENLYTDFTSQNNNMKDDKKQKINLLFFSDRLKITQLYL